MNRPTLASSSAASTSSSTQNGAGRTSSIANSSATAVSARSPPESIARAWGFLPGGRAVISIPVVDRSFGSVSESRAKPPPNSCWKRASKATSSAANVEPELGRDQDVEVGDQRARPSDGLAQVLVLGLERLEPVADACGTRRPRTGWRHRARGSDGAGRPAGRATAISASGGLGGPPGDEGPERAPRARRPRRPPRRSGRRSRRPDPSSSSRSRRLRPRPRQGAAARPRPAPRARRAPARAGTRGSGGPPSRRRPTRARGRPRAAAARARRSRRARPRPAASARRGRRPGAAPAPPRARASAATASASAGGDRRAARRPPPGHGARAPRCRRRPRRSAARRGRRPPRRPRAAPPRPVGRGRASPPRPRAGRAARAARPAATPTRRSRPARGRRSMPRMRRPSLPAAAPAAVPSSAASAAHVPFRLVGQPVRLGPVPGGLARRGLELAPGAAFLLLRATPCGGRRRTPAPRAASSAARASDDRAFGEHRFPLRLRRLHAPCLGLASQSLRLGPRLERRVAASDPDRDRVEHGAAVAGRDDPADRERRLDPQRRLEVRRPDRPVEQRPRGAARDRGGPRPAADRRGRRRPRRRAAAGPRGSRRPRPSRRPRSAPGRPAGRARRPAARRRPCPRRTRARARPARPRPPPAARARRPGRRRRAGRRPGVPPSRSHAPRRPRAGAPARRAARGCPRAPTRLVPPAPPRRVACPPRPRARGGGLARLDRGRLLGRGGASVARASASAASSVVRRVSPSVARRPLVLRASRRVVEAPPGRLGLGRPRRLRALDGRQLVAPRPARGPQRAQLRRGPRRGPGPPRPAAASIARSGSGTGSASARRWRLEVRLRRRTLAGDPRAVAGGGLQLARGPRLAQARAPCAPPAPPRARRAARPRAPSVPPSRRRSRPTSVSACSSASSALRALGAQRVAALLRGRGPLRRLVPAAVRGDDQRRRQLLAGGQARRLLLGELAEAARLRPQLREDVVDAREVRLGLGRAAPPRAAAGARGAGRPRPPRTAAGAPRAAGRAPGPPCPAR